jgi:hypothetical protein
MATTVARIRLRKHGGGDRFTVRITAGSEKFVDGRTQVTSPVSDGAGFSWNVRIVHVVSEAVLLLEMTPVAPERKGKRGTETGDITLVTQMPTTNTPVMVDYVED